MNVRVIAPRDVINAGLIRDAIIARSRARRDHPDIRRWLETHFFRWVIGCFEHALPVTDAKAWHICVGAQPVPNWFQAKLAAGVQGMIYIDAEHNLLREQEARLVEFLHSRLDTRLAGRFQRISFAAADEAWRKDHERMRRKRTRGWWPSHRQVLTEIITTPNGRFVELRGSGDLLRAEMAYESFHMQHCLGQFANHDRLEGGYGEQYAKGCEEGRIRLFSLRDANNHPHVTISLADDLGDWSVDQIKGKQNSVPATRYMPDVLLLLNNLRPRPNDSTDLMFLGLVAHELPTVLGRTMGFSYQAFAELASADLQHDLVANLPHLLALHPDPDVQLQWLALGAGGDIAATTAEPGAAIIAALAAMALDASAPSAGEKLAEIFASHFPNWQGTLLAKNAPSSEREGGGWLSRLLAPAKTSSPTGEPDTYRKWALAMTEPLFHRHAVTGMTRGLRLSAPSAVPQRQQSLIRTELGLDQGRDEEVVARFRQEFFRVPEFELLGASARGQKGLACQLLAAHAMRQSYILRLLAAWGLIDETLGWALLFLNAQRVRDCFLGWEEFGLAAARGRATRAAWLSREPHHGQGTRPSKATENEWQDFHTSPEYIWKRLEWSSFDLVMPGLAPHPSSQQRNRNH
ncbi:DUF1266 domain-containing protein [Rhizobium rhizogenes]|uniref:DUF1266 domain-containing protein n=1 Tax=Rhizobium rhizogenes TaxID=359 RepID=UPI001571F513|nr:DUF1266 domain-containing protein [Rhizobium rhizogenes]NTF46335.1 DUF1266 domain-containing protein [Rhizobium rhizogenes]